MGRAKQTVAYLDTHVIVWLYAGEVNRFSAKAQDIIETHSLYYSPLVEVELKYLHEIKKVIIEPAEILEELAGSIGLQSKPNPFHVVTHYALKLSWTRDLFDRLITAEAAINNDWLLTSDRKILQHYPHAIW